MTALPTEIEQTLQRYPWVAITSGVTDFREAEAFLETHAPGQWMRLEWSMGSADNRARFHALQVDSGFAYLPLFIGREGVIGGLPELRAHFAKLQAEGRQPVDSLATLYQSLLAGLGEDVQREGLVDTPLRAVKALQHLTRGYQQNLDDLVNNALFSSENDEMVLLRDIELYSLCEHHVLPIIGKAHIVYLPNGKVIGLSKLARIVDMFAARLQIQENLTRQIADAIADVTQARGVAVVIEARHMCMTMRGIEKQNSSMTTSVMLGAFREDPRTREEFLDLIRR